ncbi:MAG: sugar phosphate nucleotidyltransferase, partial [Candidatus Nanohaloarchaea archaeon]
ELDDRSQASSFGVVDTDGDRIVGFEEKPEEPPSSLISTGVYYFPGESVSLFHEYEDHFSGTDVPADQYLDEPGRLIEWAHERTDMYAFSFDGDWFDVGSPEGYLDALDAVMDGNIVKGKTSNCDIGDNVLVLQDTVLENVEIENSVVFPETEIRNSAVRNSLIDSHSEIEDADINDAILGKHSAM